MADVIATAARNAKRRAQNIGIAISEWEADLGYLYDEYYVGHFRFTWPDGQIAP